MIARSAHFVWRATYARYVMASGCALAADISCFMLLFALGIRPVPASVVGYSLGVAVHWMISSRLVFTAHATGAERHRQKALFVGSALLGLAITSSVVGLASHFGLDPRLAKLAAIGASFQATYALRKSVVFTRRHMVSGL